MDIVIKRLEESDKPLVLDLLATDHLRTEGILEEGTIYWGAFAEDKLAGVIGCEFENRWGLLRSALVDKQYRKVGIAEKLTKVLLQAAKEDNRKAVYLFSTGAGDYWTRLGFKQTLVEEAAEKLAGTPR